MSARRPAQRWPGLLHDVAWRRTRRRHARQLRGRIRALPEPVLLTGVPGNIGDLLIASGIEAVLGDLVVDRVTYPVLGAGRGRTLIVPGSGAWSRHYHEWLPDTVLRASHGYDQVVVLPSTYEPHVPVVHEALSRPNVVAMAREQVSTGLLEPYGGGPLSLDCAVYSPLVARPARAVPPEADPLVCLRTDLESALPAAARPAANRDISAVAMSLDDWVQSIGAASRVVTDRAHVMLAGVLLGRPVEFGDGSGFKNRALADFTFHGLFGGRLRYRDSADLVAASRRPGGVTAS